MSSGLLGVFYTYLGQEREGAEGQTGEYPCGSIGREDEREIPAVGPDAKLAGTTD